MLTGTTVARLLDFFQVYVWMHNIAGMPRPEFADAELWSLLTSASGRKFLRWEELLRTIKLRGEVEDNTKPELEVVGQPQSGSEPENQVAMAQSKAAINKDAIWMWRRYMLITRVLQATDPRDKLYSVLGMVGRGIKPEYDKPIEIVYREFAERCVRADERLGILCYAGHGISGQPEFPRHRLFVPSWVPNWDLLSKEFTWGILGNTNFALAVTGQIAKADGDYSEMRKSWTINGNHLTAKGLTADTVNLARRLQHDSDDDYYTFCCEFWDRHEEKTYWPLGIPLQRAMVRAAFLDRDLTTNEDLSFSIPPSTALQQGVLWLSMQSQADADQVRRRFDIYTYAESYRAFVDTTNMSEEETDEAVQRAIDNEVHRAVTDNHPLSMALVHHRLSLFIYHVAFTTESGYLGWGPPGMLSGDIVCVLYGCEMPVVLRMVDDHYLHIGPCYVLGLMNGELAEAAREGTKGVLVNFDIL
jgi:hypothetical protein